jgi:hypothetical protein
MKRMGRAAGNLYRHEMLAVERAHILWSCLAVEGAPDFSDAFSVDALQPCPGEGDSTITTSCSGSDDVEMSPMKGWAS